MATFKSNRRAEKIRSIVSSGIVLLLVVNCQFVAASLTWTAPPPAWTQTDPNDFRTVDMPLRNGSTQMSLRWDYAPQPGSNLQSTEFSIEDGNSDVIGKIFHTSGFTTINYPTRFNISRSEVATLIINKVTEGEEAVYQCKLETVSNTVLNIWRYRIRVIVTVPVNLTVSGDQEVLEGLNMKLFCNATAGRPTPSITWTKVLEDGSDSEVLHNTSTWDFPNINRTVSGTYRCTAGNEVQIPVIRSVKVNVIYPAKIVKLKSEYEVAAQESLSLECEAEGNPQPTYTWTPCEPQQSVCNNSKLNFPGARNNSVYTYTCKVANALDSETRNTSVFIASDVINVTLVITSESCTNGEYDQALWEKLSNKIDDVFANKIGYKSVQLKDISCGSVIVDLALKFSSTVKEIKVLSILEEAVKNGMFGDFNVSAIRGTRHDPETTTVATSPTSPSDGETTWIIVGAVLGSLVVVAVVVAVIVCVRKKRKCKRKDTKVHSSESQEQGTENVQGGNGEVNPGYVTVESNHNPRVANPPSVTYDTVEQSRKGQREVPVGKDTPTVSYAVVDKSKQKKKDKKPKPGELQYAELAEFNPRSQGMPRSSASYGQGHPTETQYADVNAM